MSDSYTDAIRKVSEDVTARSRAADNLLRAFMRVRADLEPSGWVLMENRGAPQGDHFLVGFTMRWAGRDVDQCVFKVGPGRLIQFEERGVIVFTGSVDDTGETELHRLIETWAGTMQAQQALKRPLLQEEDGARFYGGVDEIEGGQWRAAYQVRLDRGGSVLSEEADSQLFETKADALAWMTGLAAHRGFTKWYDDSPDQPAK
jgi:hypothetical protein